MRKTVFFVSDGTAITAETLGHSLLTQFNSVEFREIRLPFVDTVEKMSEAVSLINRAAEKDASNPLVFVTIVDENIGRGLHKANAHVFDLFQSFIGQLEAVLDASRSGKVGQAHGMSNLLMYEDRMEATNFALTHDDGISKKLGDADVLLVGVSRSGKTPTCLYLALHYGIKAANYPLTEEDLEQARLPAFLRQHGDKLFGLTIDPERLSQIRNNRRPNSRYASIKQCRYEVDAAEALLRSENVPTLSSTDSSIEELASRILVELGLRGNPTAGGQ